MVDKPMRIKISDGKDSILDHEVLDDAKLAKFGENKKDILDKLRTKSKHFDKEKAWRSLTGFARSYFARGSVKQRTMPAWERRERLREITKNLRPARRLVERIMQIDVGGDLYSVWCEANPYFRGNLNDLEPIKVFDPVRTKNEFDKVIAGLATLEAAASRAADDVRPTKRGTPAILPREEVWQLAALYRNSTGLIPGAGEGSFADFVVEVMTALGRYNPDEGKRVSGKITFLGVVDAIQATRRWALTDPLARKWGPSPFDEEE